MNLLAWLAGGVMSVLTGLATWWITWSRARLDEKRRMKRELLTQIVANRYDLKGDPFSQAINAAAVVFAESSDVKKSIRRFHDEVSADDRDPKRIQKTLLNMIRDMFEDLGLNHGDLSDEFLVRPFNTRQTSATKRAIGGPTESKPE